ncbi:MAG: nucleotidyltransferase domain-containing protein [Synergistaceae bacterium]|nr:nucleotidyltransferase domain-containing protein [Synergistaceae bacterium]
MLTREYIIKAVQEIALRYEINEIYLFGSYARGDATEESDCDFRIVGGDIRGLFQLSGLYIDLEKALGKHVDVVITKNMKKSFYDLIKEEEVLVYAKI